MAMQTISKEARQGIAAFCLLALFAGVSILARADGIQSGQSGAVLNAPLSDQSLHILPIEADTSATSTLNIFVAGDIMLDRNVRNKINKEGFDSVFGDIEKMVQGYDVVVANLEGPMTTNPSLTTSLKSKVLQFTFDPAMAPLLKNAGFTIFGLANNHTDNFGREGLAETRGYLANSNLAYYGDPENATEVATTTTVHGITVAFVGFHQFSEENFPHVFNEIRRLHTLKEQGSVDYIIVSPHWGVEYKKTPTDYQQLLGHQFIDAGADAVIGSHPHVVETLETYKGKPIYYSLGNFVFDQNFSYDVTHGLALGITLKKNSISKLTTSEYTLIPISMDYEHTMLGTSTPKL